MRIDFLNSSKKTPDLHSSWQYFDIFVVTFAKMEDSKTIYALIKLVAQKYFPDAEVNLFGSRARNNAAPDSDYDILIITEKELTPGEKLICSH